MHKKYPKTKEHYEVELIYKPGSIKHEYHSPSMGTILKSAEKELNYYKKKHKY